VISDRIVTIETTVIVIAVTVATEMTVGIATIVMIAIVMTVGTINAVISVMTDVMKVNQVAMTLLKTSKHNQMLIWPISN
jgi:hypothetical protein